VTFLLFFPQHRLAAFLQLNILCDPNLLWISHLFYRGGINMQEQKAVHMREYGSILAGPEKRALLWLAHRMPSSINSDHLTFLGLFSMLAAGACFWAAKWNKYSLIGVVVFLFLNWFGDSLDGTLARVRQCQRPRYGYYVDHVIDLAGTTALLAGMALSGYMNSFIAVTLLASFMLVEAEVYLSTHVQQVFRLSCFYIGPTELRIVLAIGALRLLHNPWVHVGGNGPFLLFDMGGIVAIAGLFTAFLYSAIRNGRKLYKAEPIHGAGSI
jgi:archaetidylinositol phosphate synthase